MSGQTKEGFFYAERDSVTRSAAVAILEIVFRSFPELDSVIDIGCGVGTWLSVAESLGAKRLHGIDGPWLPLDDLVVDASVIEIRDLEKHWELGPQYDLGISLEVAEHLTASAGQLLVRNLAQNCKIVVFSAAIPGQQGNGHINEQWPSYWQALFKEYGMVAMDLVRPIVWQDARLPWWYRQNTVVFTSRQVRSDYYKRESVRPSPECGSLLPLDLKHMRLSVAPAETEACGNGTTVMRQGISRLLRMASRWLT